MTLPYLYSWRNNSKRRELYGRRLRIIARFRMNSAWVEFEDGQQECISRNAIRKAKNETIHAEKYRFQPA